MVVALVRIALTTHTFSGYCSTTELQGLSLKIFVYFISYKTYLSITVLLICAVYIKIQKLQSGDLLK